MTIVWITIAGAIVFATLVFVSLFRYLEPKKLASDYVCCSGNWHEAELEGCKQGLLKVPQQPVNTYTNLAYLAAGLYVQLTLGTGPAFVFALTMTYLCVGSTLFHATSTRWAGMLDVTGIYAVFAGTAAYAFSALVGEGTDPLIPTAMFVAAGAATFILSRRKHSMEWVIAALLGATYLMLVARMAIKSEWSPLSIVLLSIGLFAVAFASWVLDQKRKFPVPRWGHGLWHLFTAAAIAFAFHATHVTAEVAP